MSVSMGPGESTPMIAAREGVSVSVSVEEEEIPEVIYQRATILIPFDLKDQEGRSPKNWFRKEKSAEKDTRKNAQETIKDYTKEKIEDLIIDKAIEIITELLK